MINNILLGILNLTGLAILIIFLGCMFEKLFRNIDRNELQDYNKEEDNK